MSRVDSPMTSHRYPGKSASKRIKSTKIIRIITLLFNNVNNMQQFSEINCGYTQVTNWH